MTKIAVAKSSNSLLHIEEAASIMTMMMKTASSDELLSDINHVKGLLDRHFVKCFDHGTKYMMLFANIYTSSFFVFDVFFFSRSIFHIIFN